MNRKLNNIYLPILLIAVLLISSLFLFFAPLVYAENTDAVIDLDSTSKFATFGETFAYTVSNKLYVVANNYISEPVSFNGECVDVILNNSNIMLLVKVNSSLSIRYFSYQANSESKPEVQDQIEKVNLGDSSKFSIVKIFIGLDGHFIILYNNGTNLLAKQFEENKQLSDSPNLQVFSTDVSITDLLKNGDTKYILSNKKLYIVTSTDPIADLTSSNLVNGVENINSITYASNFIFANTDNGIYKVNPTAKSANKIADTINPNSKITTASYNGQDFIFLCNNDSIVQYLITDTSLEYFNKFNNIPYSHPTDFDILKVAKVGETVKIYSSPKNLQVRDNALEGEYILVLCKKSEQDANQSYYYIATANGTTGYIKDSTSIEYIESETEASKLAIGQYAQGLHMQTSIYKSPYATSDVLDTVDIYTKLVVINNVAQIGEEQIWPYYKVSYVKDNEIVTGYVKTTAVSPYCSLTAPVILKEVVVSTKTIGDSVYLYTLPDENSPVITYVTDGTNLNLAEEYNKDSKFTKVVYNDEYAYILTENIQTTGLTSVQITIIIVSVIVFIGTILMVVILVKRYKMGY